MPSLLRALTSRCSYGHCDLSELSVHGRNSTVIPLQNATVHGVTHDPIVSICSLLVRALEILTMTYSPTLNCFLSTSPKLYQYLPLPQTQLSQMMRVTLYPMALQTSQGSLQLFVGALARS